MKAPSLALPIIGGIEEAPAVERPGEVLEFILGGKVKSDIDAAGPLEFVEKRLAEAQAELNRAKMPGTLCDRHNAADAKPGDAAFEADDHLVAEIGRDHGLAKARQVVAEFCGLMDPQEGNRGRGVKLELVDAVIGFQAGEAGPEQFHQGLAIVVRHRLLHGRYRSDDGAHGGCPARFLAEPRLQRIIVAAQLALVGAIDDAGDDPHRPEQHEDGGRRRGQRQCGRDPRSQAEVHGRGKGVLGCNRHGPEIAKVG